MEQQSLRQPAPDFVRASAILMVIMIHVASPAIQASIGSANWWGAMVWGMLARPAVPLFFMCSGALMLDRDIPLKRLYGHNLLRIVIAMLCWALGYNLLPILKNFSLAGLWLAVKQTLTLQHEFHFYYLHILILVYVFVPVVRVFLRNAARRELEYLLIVWFAVGILFPVLRTIWPFTLVYTMTANWYIMNMTYSAIGYCVLGYYLKHYSSSISPCWFLTAWIAGFAIAFGATVALSLRAGSLVTTYMEGMSPGPMLMAFGIMGLIVRKKSWPGKLQMVTGRIAKASFCIYLVHVFVQRLLEGVLGAATSLSIVTIPAMMILIAAIGWAVYEILHLIPVVNKWLI